MESTEIQGALARGYCTERNSKKVLDPDLIMDMTAEVNKLFPPQLTEEELRTIICKHTSEMLDNPDKYGIYPTTKFYNNLIQAILTMEQERGFVKTSPSLKRQPNTTSSSMSHKLIIICDFCSKELKEFGGLLFSPPDKSGKCNKNHLCKDCYNKLVHRIN